MSLQRAQYPAIAAGVAWVALGSITPPVQAAGLTLGESRTVTVQANEPNNFSHIYLVKGRKYRFTVGSPAWNNGAIETNAGGYSSTDSLALARRHPDYKLMALVGEIHAFDNKVSPTAAKFLVGLGRASYTAAESGWLVTFANDCLACYGNNSRVVTLTVTRLE